MKGWQRTVLFTWLGANLLLVSSPALARSEDECRRAWSRAVRSYLTQNRKAGPDGNSPTDLDQAELVSQAWDQAFSSACKLETQGKRPDARVEAATIGAQLLAKLDPRGCLKFMESYMQSEKPQDVCDAAKDSSIEDLRAKVSSSIPAR